MKKQFLFFLLLIGYLDSNCQMVSTIFIEIPDYVEFRGSIDSKHNITLLLYPSSKFTFGKYYYDKIKKEISLKGSINYIHGFINDKYYEKEKVKLIEYDDKDNERAIFEGEIIDNSIFTGNWTDIKNNKTLPFELKISNYKSLIKKDRYILETRIDSSVYLFDFSKNFNYKPSIDTLIYYKQNEKYYCLLFTSHFSIGGCYDRGACGCGLEQYIIYLTFNENFESQSQQILFSESCLYNISCHYTKKDKWFSEISGFDLRKFDSYEIKIFDYQNKRETIYQLNSNCLDCGFKIISEKEIDTKN